MLLVRFYKYPPLLFLLKLKLTNQYICKIVLEQNQVSENCFKNSLPFILPLFFSFYLSLFCSQQILLIWNKTGAPAIRPLQPNLYEAAHRRLPPFCLLPRLYGTKSIGATYPHLKDGTSIDPRLLPYKIP
jgi:hypothetical protein